LRYSLTLTARRRMGREFLKFMRRPASRPFPDSRPNLCGAFFDKPLHPPLPLRPRGPMKAIQ